MKQNATEFVTTQVKNNLQLSAWAIPLSLTIAGHYVLHLLFKKDLNVKIIIAYYGLFGWLLPANGWTLALYYLPVFSAHLFGPELVPGYESQALTISYLLLKYTTFWWSVSFMGGIHVLLIGLFMYLMGQPAKRVRGSIGHQIHTYLHKYFCISTKFVDTVKDYGLKVLDKFWQTS
jgi:hypothetical protein